MKKILIVLLFIGISATLIYSTTKGNSKDMSGTIYEFSAKQLNGKDKSLADYKGKVVLIVNTASQCGFTKQYKGLQELYVKYNSKGLEILGFPCNQFGGQEPGTADEIKQFCEVNFSVTFPMFDKVDVNGDNSHPLFNFLKSEKSGLVTDDIKWNFTKFLIDKNGKPVERFASVTTPESLEKHIEKLLN
jgi:glutathione peroxidase